VKFASLPIHSVDLLQLANQQDVIGWDNFMEGKISTLFLSVQHSHLLSADSILTCHDWTHHFISKLLHITHGQWIYRNIFKNHEKQHGMLRSTERRRLLREIDHYMNLLPDEVFTQLCHESTEKQSYWVQAIPAAVTAGRRRVFVSRHWRPLIIRSVPARRPPVDFGPSDDCSDLASHTVAPAVHRSKRSGSFTDPSNKRRKPD
jgi:hypothetical protein